MNACFDTSAFLKLIVLEPGSSTVAAVWNGADLLVAGRLMYAEARAGLAAAGRQGRVASREIPQAKRQLALARAEGPRTPLGKRADTLLNAARRR